MQAQVPLLVVQEGQLLGHEWSLDRDMMTLGRGEECDMTVPERQVSRVHLRIQRDASGYLVEDLDSKNGTFVNGRQVQPGTPVRLQDGDEITVALCVRLLFVGAEATVPLAGREAVPVTASGLRLDKAQRRVWIGDRELQPPLSLAQYRLIELLADAGGRVVSREEVVAAVWPEAIEEGVSEQAIDALVRRLRDRLAELDPEREYVMTVRGHGFRLADEPVH
jgi:pSer/pThr/pTyr-binding forkhead associated (FHA) protein